MTRFVRLAVKRALRKYWTDPADDMPDHEAIILTCEVLPDAERKRFIKRISSRTGWQFNDLTGDIYHTIGDKTHKHYCHTVEDRTRCDHEEQLHTVTFTRHR